MYLLVVSPNCPRKNEFEKPLICFNLTTRLARYITGLLLLIGNTIKKQSSLFFFFDFYL